MGYATDLTDKKWDLIEPIFRSNKGQQAYAKYSTIQKFCSDDGYRKSFEEDAVLKMGSKYFQQ